MSSPLLSDLRLAFAEVDALPAVAIGSAQLRRAAPEKDLDPRRPTLLFVAGAYHGAWCYAYYLRFFCALGWPCAALDLPGHDGGPVPDGFARLGVEDYADVVRAACVTIDGPVILIGHSLGALPVMVSLDATNAVGLVLLAPSPPANLPGVLGLAAVAGDDPVAPPGLDVIRGRFLGVTAHADVDVDVAVVQQRLCPESPRALNDRYLLRIDIDPASVRVPGLCLSPSLDVNDRHPPGQDAALARFLGLAHREVADLPHCLMYVEGWERGAQEISGWLAAHFDVGQDTT